MNAKINWKKLGIRSLNIYKTDIYMKNLRKAYKKHFIFDFDNLITHGNGYECTVYVGENDLTKLREITKDYFLTAIKTNKDPFEFLNKLSENHINITKEIANRTISSRSELLKAYNDFIDTLEDLMIIIWLPVMTEGAFFSYAQNILNKYILDEKAWSVVTEPFEPSIIQEEMLSLLKVNSNEELEEHKDNFVWLGMRFVDNEPKNTDYFRKRLDEIQNSEEELIRINKDLEKKKKRFFGLLDYLDVSEADRKLFICVNKANQLRQTRDKTRRMGYHYLRPMFNKILEELKMDYKTLFNLTHDELVSLLKNKKNNAPDFMHIFKHGKFELIKTDIDKRLEEEGIISSKIEDVNEFKGTIACSGKVKGRVKVIDLNKWEDDVAAVKKDDILVAISTKPDYIVAMERASAFITDEGGVTCHAAIVAREMNKPCIVGTNVATKVLKDGDLVEIDADNGIVKKIKEKK